MDARKNRRIVLLNELQSAALSRPDPTAVERFPSAALIAFSASFIVLRPAFPRQLLHICEQNKREHIVRKMRKRIRPQAAAFFAADAEHDACEKSVFDRRDAEVAVRERKRDNGKRF